MKILKYKLLNYLNWKIFGDYPVLSYSRAGEDCILFEILSNVKSGFYVDIGCYHPVKSSNTFMFYQKGWKGINIDANETAIELFRKARKRDININCAIDIIKGKSEYYIFDKNGFDQMNTISSEFKQFAIDEFDLKVKEVKIVETNTLENILDKYLPKNQEIDFLNVDVEGKDLEVLNSNNWNKYKPKVILAEITGNINDLKENEISKFLKNYDYEPIAFSPITLKRGNIFFIKK